VAKKLLTTNKIRKGTKGSFAVPRDFSPEAKRYAQSVNDTLQQLTGEKGSYLDKAVTFQDLINAGIARELYTLTGGGGVIGPGTGRDVDGPTAPTGVEAVGAFQFITISWDYPNYDGHSHTEIWVNNSNDFATKTFLAQTTASIFSHEVGNGATKYYWVRHVNRNDELGAFHSETPVSATTAPDIAHLMGLLDEQLQDLPGYATLNSDLSDITQSIQDEAAAASRVIKSTSAPTVRSDGSSLQPGDIWIDTDDNNQMYVRNASNNGWTKARDSSLISLYNTLSSTVSTNSTNIATAQGDIITLTTDTSANASAITNLQSSLTTTNSNVSANSSSISSLTTQVQSNDNDITSISGSLTSLTTTVNTINGDYATGTALNALTSRVSTAEGSITSINTSLISLQSQITANDLDITGNATAISGLDTRVTSAEGNITAQASSITQLQTDVGDNEASITTLQTTTADLEGYADASYVLQVNSNGHIAGFLVSSSTSPSGQTTSDVVFQADRFRVVGTSGTGVSTPFTVVTTPFTQNGETVPAGTYIETAYIQNGAITSAQIGTLGVDKLFGSFADLETVMTGTLSADSIQLDGVTLDTDGAGNLVIANGGISNVHINDLSADKITAGTINSDRINTDTLAVKHFANVSSNIESHIVSSPPAPTYVPLQVFGSVFHQPSSNFTTIVSTVGTYLQTSISEVRNGAKYQAIWSGVYGDCTNGVLEYSVDNSTWVQAAGGIQNVTFAAGTFRTYVFAYNGTISGLSSTSDTVYWRVRWITKLRTTYQSLYVFIDNTQ
jgi:predicted  nucleic acid-binding Zn-ribbon protein